MALRFLMGVFEAGFGPGIPYLMSFFYRRHELGLRCGLFLSAAPLANTFAGALAYGITSGHAALASWRVLFLVEGLPVCAAALLAYFYLPDKPSAAKFLDEEEKEVARARGLQQSGEPERESKIQWGELAGTLSDAKAWFTAVRTPPQIKLHQTTNNLLVNVLQLQRQLLLAPRLPTHHPQRNGLHSHQRSRSHRTTVLRILLRDDRHHMGGRSPPAAWADDRRTISDRRCGIPPVCDLHFCRRALSRRLPGCVWDFSVDREYPSLGSE